MKVAYCDCFSGISGDMFLGAMLDAGLPLMELETQLKLLGLAEPYRLESSIVNKNGFRARKFSVRLNNAHENGDDEDHHDHDHPHHRHYTDIVQLIESSSLESSVRETSLKIFHRIAEAEAYVHGVDIGEVHFHEVGALDSIIDIVGAAIGINFLKIQRLYSSALPWGGGEILTDHGKLPLPAPATLQLMRSANAVLKPVDTQYELVTPTGAAILAALAVWDRPAMIVQKVGIGAGERDLSWANIFRLIIGEVKDNSTAQLIQMETNIDDMNPQIYGHLMDRLFSAGALDVYLTPIYMKKNRPATLLGVIAKHEDERALAGILLNETSTLGVRIHPIYRYEAEREVKEIQTEYGSMRIKCKQLDGKIVQAAPEYEDCLRIARDRQVPIVEVLNAGIAAGRGLLHG